ncbi:MAG TPA: hypothetical protein VF796_28575, partial [Humisphaera sp.]
MTAALRRPLVAAACVLVTLLAAPRAGATVKVVKIKPKVEHREFDPNNKPKDMPTLNRNEAALC